VEQLPIAKIAKKSNSKANGFTKTIAELNFPAEIAATLISVVLSMALTKVAWMTLSMTLWAMISKSLPILTDVRMESDALWLSLLKVVWKAFSMVLWIVAPTVVIIVPIMESEISPWKVGSKVALKVVFKIAMKLAIKAV